MKLSLRMFGILQKNIDPNYKIFKLNCKFLFFHYESFAYAQQNNLRVNKNKKCSKSVQVLNT